MTSFICIQLFDVVALSLRLRVGSVTKNELSVSDCIFDIDDEISRLSYVNRFGVQMTSPMLNAFVLQIL